MTKKQVITFLTAIAANIVGLAFGQGVNQMPSENAIAYSQPLAVSGTPALRLNEVHAKAVRSFARDYKDATDAKWFSVPDGFAVYFMHKNVKARIYYGKRGNYICAARYYTEAVLPREVRHLVRSHYYDHDIYHVVEVSGSGGIAYLIKMEGKTSWMDIRVMNDEIEILNEYEKQ